MVVLSKLSFYKSILEEPHDTKYIKAFKNYTCRYSAEVLRFQNPTSQLNIAKPPFKNLLKDLLAEMKSFKFQITLGIILSKEIENDETKYSPPIYFSSNAKTVIND